MWGEFWGSCCHNLYVFWNQVDSNRYVDKCLDSGYISKIGIIGFNDGLDLGQIKPKTTHFNGILA